MRGQIISIILSIFFIFFSFRTHGTIALSKQQILLPHRIFYIKYFILWNICCKTTFILYFYLSSVFLSAFVQNPLSCPIYCRNFIDRRFLLFCSSGGRGEIAAFYTVRKKSKFPRFNMKCSGKHDTLSQTKSTFRDITWNLAGKTWYFAEYFI